jgi:hypothetical protein
MNTMFGRGGLVRFCALAPRGITPASAAVPTVAPTNFRRLSLAIVPPEWRC